MMSYSTGPSRCERQFSCGPSQRPRRSKAELLAADSFRVSPCRHLIVLALVATTAVVGIPLPVSAASEEPTESQTGSASNKELPSWRLDSSPALETWSPRWQTVEAPLAHATSHDAEAKASIRGASQGRFDEAGPIAGSVARLTRLVTADQTQRKSVNSGSVLQPPTSGPRRRGALFWTAVGGGAGVVSALIFNAANPACDASDNMCSANVVVFGGIGALMGFLVGAGR